MIRHRSQELGLTQTVRPSLIAAPLPLLPFTSLACSVDPDASSPTEGAHGRMGQKGYALVRRDQAEDARAAYTAGAQRRAPNR